MAYVGPVSFPEGGAAARRILGNALALVASGREVVVVSGQPASPSGIVQQIAPGIRCVSVNERDAEHLPKALRYTRYSRMGLRSRAWLAAQPTMPDAVILYSGYLPYLLHLTGWARQRGIPLLFDAVEWYTAQTPAGFLASPYLWSTEFAMRVLIPRTDGVITVSRALERYYAARGLPVVRVPPLLDIEALEPRAGGNASGPLRLIYAGSPGHKDRLDAIVAGVLATDAGHGRLKLDVAGVDEAEFRRLPALGGLGDEPLPASLVAHGTVGHARVLELVGAADFSVLLRPVNRVSTCGFPTKFVESLALGTPAIANITGDLGRHLREGETGLVCPDPGTEAFRAVLVRALALPPEARAALRRGARAEAECAFDFRRYAEAFGAFFDGPIRK